MCGEGSPSSVGRAVLNRCSSGDATTGRVGRRCCVPPRWLDRGEDPCQFGGTGRHRPVSRVDAYEVEVLGSGQLGYVSRTPPISTTVATRSGRASAAIQARVQAAECPTTTDLPAPLSMTASTAAELIGQRRRAAAPLHAARRPGSGCRACGEARRGLGVPHPRGVPSATGEGGTVVRPPMGRLEPDGDRCVLVGSTRNPSMYAQEWLATVPFDFSVEEGAELRAAVATVAARFSRALSPSRPETRSGD